MAINRVEMPSVHPVFPSRSSFELLKFLSATLPTNHLQCIFSLDTSESWLWQPQFTMHILVAFYVVDFTCQSKELSFFRKVSFLVD